MNKTTIAIIIGLLILAVAFVAKVDMTFPPKTVAL
jgi:hypothetical protein